MAKSTRIMIGGLIGLLIIGAGLGVGFFASRLKPPAETAKTTLAKPDIPANPNIYDASPPNRASQSHTKEIKISPTGPTMSFVMLPADEAADFRTGQQILLYDANGTIIETLGEIREIKQGSGPFEGKTTIHMSLGSDDGVDISAVASGKVIIGQTDGAEHLPLSALVKDDGDNPFVWEAATARDGTITARKVAITILTSTYDHFVMSANVQTGGVYILTPDKSLRDGQAIRIKSVLYEGPQTASAAQIETVMNKRQQRLQAIADQRAAMNGAPTGTGQASQNACAPALGAMDEFMNAVRRETPTTQAPAP